jgi:ribose transport system ATP-binding protein
VANGLLLVPEDRRSHGLVIDESVQHNVGLPSLEYLSRFRLVKTHLEAVITQYYCDLLHVRAPSIQQKVGLLSGGNQQKVVLAKWLARPQLRVLILDEPTRGIDVGSKSEIYALMDELTQNGVAVLMISSDLEEILGMSDRVLVMHQGRLAGVLLREALSEERIMRLATGQPEEALNASL